MKPAINSKVFGMSLAAAAAVLIFGARSSATVLDRIIATVNGDAIFYSDFSARLKPFISQLDLNVTDKDEKAKQLKQMKKQLLDSMIEEKVLLEEAKKKKIEITSSEIDQGVAEIRGRFKTEAEYKNELKNQGLTPSKMRGNIKDQLMTIKLINRQVRSSIPEPTEKESRDFYNSNEDKMIVGEQVRVKQIFFEVKKGASKAEKAAIRKKAESVLAKLKKSPSSFPELVEKYSDAPENGGDTGYFGRGEKIPEFEEPCFKLKVGAISGVFETPLGFHIVKCVGKNAPEKKTYKESKDYIKNYLFQMAMDQKYSDYVRDLRDQASIKILDKDFIGEH